MRVRKIGSAGEEIGDQQCSVGEKAKNHIANEHSPPQQWGVVCVLGRLVFCWGGNLGCLPSSHGCIEAGPVCESKFVQGDVASARIWKRSRSLCRLLVLSTTELRHCQGSFK
eukprot:6117064-Amphidinium_carterae.1